MLELFDDRDEAGRLLAGELEQYRGREDVVVLALPRGGVPVAFEVARTLGAPLDVLPVRKLGVPGYEELAMGAIAAGGVRVLNDDVLSQLPIPASKIDEVVRTEQRELERRSRAYRGDEAPLSLSGKTVILVDDGLATGATMHAALLAARQQLAKRVVVAVPVAPAETYEAFRRLADKVVCLMQPEPFYAVGSCYRSFPQVTDDEVRALLRDSKTTQEQT